MKRKIHVNHVKLFIKLILEKKNGNRKGTNYRKTKKSNKKR